MKKNIAALFSVLIILVFIGYMIYDSIQTVDSTQDVISVTESQGPGDLWEITREFKVTEGTLKAVTVSQESNIYLAGDSFVSCFDKELNLIWNKKMSSPVTSLSYHRDTLFASTAEQIFLMDNDGEIINEWGPFETNSIITSVSSNNRYVAFADAGNKTIYILDKGGEVKKMVGHNDGQFIVPSPYFDVAINEDNSFFVGNTGHRRVEHRDNDGKTLTFFGEPGTSPEAFCGCCNPAHFIVIPEGFVTAEKGINRIKILDKSGKFVEYVSSKNKFMASIPLDLASPDGKAIYAANSDDSKLYIFKRK